MLNGKKNICMQAGKHDHGDKFTADICITTNEKNVCNDNSVENIKRPQS